jgi:hypothetical protein
MLLGMLNVFFGMLASDDDATSEIWKEKTLPHTKA